MSNLNLMNIMREDPEFGRRITKKVKEIKQDRQNLLNIAQEYETKYREEIQEGTKLRAKLLTEGKFKGLTEDEIMRSYGKFLLTLATPILNLLYFLLRESDDDPHYGQHHYAKRDKINEFMVKNNQMEYNEDYTTNITEEDAEKLMTEFLDEVFVPSKLLTTDERRQVNYRFKEEQKLRLEKEEVELKEPEKMEEFLYGNLNLSQFEVLKKLKALSCSSNVHEAVLAFKKGKELCERYELDWNKIPCYIEKK